MFVPEINISEEQAVKNVNQNIRRPYPQFQPHEEQDQHLAIIAGGPSLNEDDIREKVNQGVKLVSINGTHNWLIERGFYPSVHVMVDGREFNERFVRNPDSRCKYFIASQCHPKVFENLEGQDVYIWHAISYKSEKRILDEYYKGQYFEVVAGSTATLRALLLLRMLGFKRFEMFGFDSCFLEDKHHAYPQPENDTDLIKEIKVYSKTFKVCPWMASQREDFHKFTKQWGRDIELIVHGNGLIAHEINRLGESPWLRLLGNFTILRRSISATLLSIWTRITSGGRYILQRVTPAPRP